VTRHVQHIVNTTGDTEVTAIGAAHRTVARLGLTVAVALSLGACAGSKGMRESMGLAAPPPDEFMVVARAPLELPPDLSALPTPQPGAPSRVEPNPRAEAQAALMGDEVSAAPAAAPTAGEAALLSAAGAGPQNAEVREQIAQDESATPTRRFGLTSLFGRKIVQDPEAEAERLSPEAEAERLQREGLPAPAAPSAP